MTLLECYQKLGISKTDSAKDVKKAYRKMAMKYHPDVNASENAEHEFREIFIAYETILQYIDFKEKHYGTIEDLSNTTSFDSKKYYKPKEPVEERIRKAQEKMRKKMEAEREMFFKHYQSIIHGWKYSYMKTISVFCIIVSVFIFIDLFFTSTVKEEDVRIEEKDFVSNEELNSYFSSLYVTIGNQTYGVGREAYLHILYADKVFVTRTYYLNQIISIRTLPDNVKSEIFYFYKDSIIVLCLILLIPAISFFFRKPDFLYSIFFVGFSIYIIPIILLYIFLGNLRIINLLSSLGIL